MKAKILQVLPVPPLMRAQSKLIPICIGFLAMPLAGLAAGLPAQNHSPAGYAKPDVLPPETITATERCGEQAAGS